MCIRDSPTTESRIIKQFYDGDSVKLLYRYDENWLYVEYDGTFRGYVAKEYVDLSSIDDSTLDIVDEINPNRFVAVVKDDCTSLNLRADASTEAESVGSAGPGATLEVLDYQEGAEWIKVKKDDKMCIRDRYCALSEENDQSYHYFMREHLFRHINVPDENIHIPSGRCV